MSIFVDAPIWNLTHPPSLSLYRVPSLSLDVCLPCERNTFSKIAKHASYAGVRLWVIAIRDCGLRVVEVEGGVGVEEGV